MIFQVLTDREALSIITVGNVKFKITLNEKPEGCTPSGFSFGIIIALVSVDPLANVVCNYRCHNGYCKIQ